MKSYTFVLGLIAFAATSGTSVNAEDNYLSAGSEIISLCRADYTGIPENDACYGLTVDICMNDFPGEAVIQTVCWEAELAVWDSILNMSYQELITDVGGNGFDDFIEPIRVSQRSWLKQIRLDCQLEVMSNPQTYGLIWPACLAKATMNRGFFLQGLGGANWSEFEQ